MNAAELARGALLEIRVHPARSAMTAFSLSIGVAAMLYTFSSAGGVARRYKQGMALAGAARLSVNGKSSYVSRGLSPGLTVDDAKEIRRLWPGLAMVYPRDSRWSVRMSWRGRDVKDAVVYGTTEEWRRRDWVYSLRGRFIDAHDVAWSERVCVVFRPGGWKHKPFWAANDRESPFDALVLHHDLLGERLLIEGHVFRVVGVLQAPLRDEDPRWFEDNSANILMPISAMHHAFVGDGRQPGQVETIQIDTGDASTAARDQARVAALLLRRHRGEKDVEVEDYRRMALGAIQHMHQTMISILIIGVVAILASGIGIMNVTLATVFSRVREIGIRRALGATRRDVVAQFVAEALLLGAIGGAAGCVEGLAAVLYLSPHKERVLMPTALHYAAAVAVALGTAFLFAILPSYRASRYDPVDALRYE